MSTERNADRIMRAWLEHMPDEAPDRLIAAVLQAVETTPQQRRPLDRARWRFPNMNRLLIAAATTATIVIVAAGVALYSRSEPSSVIGGPSPSPTTGPTSSSPSPSPLPSASAPAGAELPASLVGTWLGPTKPIFGSSPGGSVLKVGQTSVAMFAPNAQGQPVLRADASIAGGDIRLVTPTTPNSCQAGDIGTYSVVLSPSGQTLSIESAGDPCVSRGRSIAGTWWLADCRDAQDTCLGPIDAGSYGSQYFTSFLAHGVRWAPVYGGVTFTVPDGWANDADWPEAFTLAPASEERTTVGGNDPANAIVVMAHAVAESQATPCSGVADTGVAPGAASLISWLRTLPGLRVGPTTHTSVAGQAALSVDLSVADAPSRLCGGTDPVIEYLFSPGWTSAADGGAHVHYEAIGAGSRERLILLDQQSGDLIAIIVEVADTSQFDAFASSAMPIVDSFRFPVSFPGG